MLEFLASIYPWLKAGHIIFVIFWMAGLFMLPRFFVYHQEDGPAGSDADGVWIERERRLLKIILLPSMIIVWALGLLLAWVTGAYVEGWFHAKLLFVLALSGYHGWMSGYAKKLARGERTLEGRKLRLLNEVPGLAAAVVVVLAIVRPF
ncbi:CopD family protein [Erythrobacter sp. HKB08]|uniref:CopD family protein n=1 Tax=Erythrobacter sp. HKB08 TaxID=2502843 RepID=UPI0010093BF4|nr:CopD family protein [Erythrobacter sp. HKB08]